MRLVDLIRFVPVQRLAELFDVNRSQVSRWISGRPYLDSQLDGACRRFGLVKSEVVEGLELRRSDRRMRQEAESFAASLLARHKSYEIDDYSGC